MHNLNNLEYIYDSILNDLTDSYNSRKHKYHLLGLTTVSRELPNICIMAMKGFDENEHCIILNSDMRSQEVKNCLENDKAHLVFWDEVDKVQLRISVKVVLKYESLEKNYIDGQIKNYFNVRDSYLNLKNFVLINCYIKKIDYLKLKCTGHTRAVFEIHGDKVEKYFVSA